MNTPALEEIEAARDRLRAAGFTSEQIEAPTGFGLRGLPNCPAVAPLCIKVAAGALSIQGALRTTKTKDKT